MNKKFSTFIQYVRRHLKEHGGKLIIGRGSNINGGDGCRCSGTYGERIIRVAGKNSCFLEVLVHEYCHFLQDLEVHKSTLLADEKAGEIMFGWLTGEKQNKQDVEKAFSRIRIMERDCEKRSVHLIKKFNLPINIESYIQKANCYIYLHYIMRERRSWNCLPGLNPMKSNKVLKLMPKTFKAKSDKIIPENIHQMLLKFFP